MGLDLEYIDGQTPLDEDEKDGLLVATVATRGELDEFEQQNIEQAIQWALTRSFKPEAIFTQDFICNVHKRMYAAVWAWAGQFRKTNKNIALTNGKYQPNLNTCWMMPSAGMKTTRTQQMK